MIHQPTQNDTYNVELISSGYEPPETIKTINGRRIRRHRKLYKITGNMDGKPIEGEMAIYKLWNNFEGYDWNGTKLGNDEQQVLLDLFADEV
jgi:hypothetical protein